MFDANKCYEVDMTCFVFVKSNLLLHYTCYIIKRCLSMIVHDANQVKEGGLPFKLKKQDNVYLPIQKTIDTQYLDSTATV